MNSNFIDYIKIHCKSGNGGAGLVHFHREKFISKGGPDGGKGGKGGNIILRGNNQLWSFISLKYIKHIKAGNGKTGGPSCITGTNGNDITLEVPVGSIIKNELGKIIFEINKHREEKILMHGGKGGLGNWYFRSATNQSPRYSQPGLLGNEGYIIFELKLLADVGLVGFPNVGKSTLLSIISNAKPKISHYPFTTINPNLGIVSYRNFQSFVMADIPGIIEGASKGKGLGYKFLQHIEKNSILLFIIASDSLDHFKEYKTLLKELKTYNAKLIYKKIIISISKSDFLDNELKIAIQNQFKNHKVIFFSSITKEGIINLKDKIWNLLHSNFKSQNQSFF